jgi:hypothetical protein
MDPRMMTFLPLPVHGPHPWIATLVYLLSRKAEQDRSSLHLAELVTEQALLGQPPRRPGQIEA